VFVDYDYYTDTFKGTLLTEDEFNKYGNDACIYITASTMSRVTDSTISIYPASLIDKIKRCACVLSEYLKRVADVESSLTGVSSSSEGMIKSKTAGSVSVSYDTTTAVSYYLDISKQEEAKQGIIRQYLSPIVIGTIYYNLLSKVIDSGPDICPCCSI